MDAKTQKILARAERVIEIAKRCAKTEAGQHRVGEVILHYAGVVEPGYDNHDVVALGNWNEITRWNDESREYETTDNIMVRLANVLGSLGAELHWEDEWDYCRECCGLFRTTGDCHSWQPSFHNYEDEGPLCIKCIEQDPEWHLKQLEGDYRHANTIETIDPAKHGYVLVQKGLERGMHPGQDADPKLAAKALKAQGIKRYVMNLDSVGQFDAIFSVYVHESEIDKLDRDKWDAVSKNGPSLSEGYKRALKAGMQAADKLKGDGVRYVTACSDGTATARLIRPREFVERGVK